MRCVGRGEAALSGEDQQRERSKPRETLGTQSRMRETKGRVTVSALNKCDAAAESLRWLAPASLKRCIFRAVDLASGHVSRRGLNHCWGGSPSIPS